MGSSAARYEGAGRDLDGEAREVMAELRAVIRRLEDNPSARDALQLAAGVGRHLEEVRGQMAGYCAATDLLALAGDVSAAGMLARERAAYERGVADERARSEAARRVPRQGGRHLSAVPA